MQRAARRAASLADKVNNLESELEEMRRRTQDICERVDRLERERCRAPDVTDMLRGYGRPEHASSQPHREPLRFSARRVDRDDLVTPEPVRSVVSPTPRAFSPIVVQPMATHAPTQRDTAPLFAPSPTGSRASAFSPVGQ
eukprot:TRINITY_DN1905_c0_g2_i7.p3 TRINITY_DN1905_c0_g2~~TRINITY_DN1905_c0_g2_i7.p3  ORF type:complete len:140 (-),score=78.03 TRINITY_DN1905_c0_g2_i7:107-526(-)